MSDSSSHLPGLLTQGGIANPTALDIATPSHDTLPSRTAIRIRNTFTNTNSHHPPGCIAIGQFGETWKASDTVVVKYSDPALHG